MPARRRKRLIESADSRQHHLKLASEPQRRAVQVWLLSGEEMTARKAISCHCGGRIAARS
jgi:hypothetical protein